MKNNKGITLIALIITIIVMLILVSVTVSIVVNSDLIGTAQGAGENTKTAYEADQTYGMNVTIKGEPYQSVEDYVNPDEYLTPGVVATKKTVYSDGRDSIIVPAGFVVSGISTEQSIANGVVIYQITEEQMKTVDWEENEDEDSAPDVQENYMSYVWVPITEEELLEKVEKDGENYKSKSDIFIEPYAFESEQANLGNKWNENLFQDEFNTAVESILEYGGYYAGRKPIDTKLEYIEDEDTEDFVGEELLWNEAYLKVKSIETEGCLVTLWSRSIASANYDGILHMAMGSYPLWYMGAVPNTEGENYFHDCNYFDEETASDLEYLSEFEKCEAWAAMYLL